ncbi:MAG: regulatory protein RecX [Solirubrobacterales bacterium]
MADEPLALALGALARKERSVAELRCWLAGRGVDPSGVERVVEQLLDGGALDDERFAERFAEDKREISGWGRERIATALEARGVGRGEIEAALAAEDREEELERAVGLVLTAVGEPADDRARGRAFGLLVRRGFGAEAAYEAVRRAGRAA